MNNFVGSPSRSNNGDATVRNPQGSGKYPPYQKVSSLRSPALTFVVLDEREDNINDGIFFTSMSRSAIPSPVILDIPGRRHGGAAGISFADGHAEMHQGTSGKLTQPIQSFSINNLKVSGEPAGLKDSYWLQRLAVGIDNP